jgi:hypothetical protein
MMMSEDKWLILGVILSAVPAYGFPILYTVFSPWWKSSIGRSIFILSFGIALLVTSSLIRLFVGPEHPLFISVRLAVYTVLPFGLWYLPITFVKTIVKARRKARLAILSIPEDMNLTDKVVVVQVQEDVHHERYKSRVISKGPVVDPDAVDLTDIEDDKPL